jgi:hypothetical protein
MSLEPFADSFRRSSRFGGNIFLLVFFAFMAVVIVIAVISAMIHDR